MSFSESLKADLRRRSDMRCCVCHSIGVDIHHIVPTCEDGSDAEDNAAPLCPSCHDTYGMNPTKRKLIREAKTNWLASCDRRLHRIPEINELIEIARGLATREDLSCALREAISSKHNSPGTCSAEPVAQPLGDIIEFFYNFAPDSSKVCQTDIDFAYTAMFGAVWRDEEMEDIRKSFLAAYGSVTARRVCIYALQYHHVSHFASGFTDDDLGILLNHITITAIMLLHHHELNSESARFDLGITIDGKLWGKMHADESSPDTVKHD